MPVALEFIKILLKSLAFIDRCEYNICVIL